MSYVLAWYIVRLDDVESRLQETAAAFEQSRLQAKKTKTEFARVKKKRYMHIHVWPPALFDFSLSDTMIL